MRKLTCLILCMILLIPCLSMSTHGVEEKPLLSEMSEAECITFLKEHGVNIPPLYKNEQE